MKRRSERKVQSGVIQDHVSVRLGLQLTYVNLEPPPAEQLLEFGVNGQQAFDRIVLRKGDVFSMTASKTDPAYLVNHSIGAIFALDKLLPRL